MKISWFCKCGWTFDEKINSHKYSEGDSGESLCYCSGCHQTLELEWYVIENTDPDEELNEISGYCAYCKQTKPNGEMLYDHKNYSHPVCNSCLEKKSENSEHDADMDAQDIKWGKDKV